MISVGIELDGWESGVSGYRKESSMGVPKSGEFWGYLFFLEGLNNLFS